MTGPFRSDESAAVPRFAPTGTAPQRPKADPKEKPGRLSFVMDEPAPVPQTEGEDK